MSSGFSRFACSANDLTVSNPAVLRRRAGRLIEIMPAEHEADVVLMGILHDEDLFSACRLRAS